MRAMAAYELALFRYKTPGSDLRIGVGKYTFEASDDPSACSYAQATYVEGLESCDYAVLWGPKRELVWQKGSPKRAQRS